MVSLLNRGGESGCHPGVSVLTFVNDQITEGFKISIIFYLQKCMLGRELHYHPEQLVYTAKQIAK